MAPRYAPTMPVLVLPNVGWVSFDAFDGLGQGSDTGHVVQAALRQSIPLYQVTQCRACRVPNVGQRKWPERRAGRHEAIVNAGVAGYMPLIYHAV